MPIKLHTKHTVSPEDTTFTKNTQDRKTKNLIIRSIKMKRKKHNL